MDPSVSPQSPEKSEKKLKCPHCGNEELREFEYFDTPTSYRNIRGIDKFGTLILSIDNEIEWDGDEEEGILCIECGHTFPCEFQGVRFE